MLVGATSIIAFPHEAFHAMSAGSEGIGAYRVDRTTTHIERLTTTNVTAGYRGEVTLFFVLALVFAFIGGPRLPFLTGGFPLGYMIATWFQAYNSSDFNSSLQSIVPAKYWTAYHADLISRWTAFCLILALVGSAIVLYRVVKKSRGRRK